MGVAVSVRLAAAALQAHGLRAALTVLGVVVGVAAVVATLSMGTGSQERIAEHMRGMGSNLIVILTGPRITTGVREPGGRLTLTEEDASALASEIPEVEAAAPVMRGTGQAVSGNRNWATVITAVTPTTWSRASGESRSATCSVRRIWTAPRRSRSLARPSGATSSTR
jgi:putative ABC transport system permease protein